MSVRTQRVRELLKRTIGEIIRREYSVTQYGVVTVNDVDISPDLKQATVWLGIVAKSDQKKKTLEQLRADRKHIQGVVGREIILKYTPVLRFEVDDSIERANRVLKILDEIEQAEKPSEAPDQTNPSDH
jgi:ribosome-binding factor A